MKSGGDDFCKKNYNQVSLRIFNDLVMIFKKKKNPCHSLSV